VVAAGVARRRGELAVRATLGATPRALGTLVLREGLTVAALGAAAGLGGALAAGRLLVAVLYDISPTDPGTLAAATLALVGVCALAAVGPAWRAARADPARVLRAE
jgi:ABC-type antimicrobial peptide transport system permease subunit